MLSGIYLGQFFLEDQDILRKIADVASIKKEEIILEIGAGDGRLTKILASQAQKVIAIEIDKKFFPLLKKMPKNVEVIFEDVLKILSKKPLPKFTKILGNLPSSLVEPLFQKLIKIKFKLAVFLVPKKFAHKIEKHQVFSLYFEVKLIGKVPKTAFQPIPRTNWEIILVTKKENPLRTKDLNLFLKRFVYEHPKAKLKNALVEGLIRFYAAQGKKITKNQAREICDRSKNLI